MSNPNGDLSYSDGDHIIVSPDMPPIPTSVLDVSTILMYIQFTGQNYLFVPYIDS